MSAIPYVLMGFMILTGSLNTIFQSLQYAEKSLEMPYRHAWVQSHNMFLGELYCLIIYYISRMYESYENTVGNNSESESEASPSIFILVIPTACDLFATTLFAFSLLNMSTSVYQMLRGGLMLVTSSLSVIFLDKNQYRHHILGLAIVLISIFLISLAGLLYGNHIEERTTNFEGIIMMLIGLIFRGFQFITEEYIINHYDINPLKMVGYEGVWGASFYTLLLILLQNIRCEHFFGRDIFCSSNNHDEWRVEEDSLLIIFLILI